MYIRTIPTYGPKHDTRGWIRGCRGKGLPINLLKSSPVYQFIYGSNLDATPAIANFWRAFEKAQSDSIPMKLQGSFLGQGRPLKTKPWLRLAKPWLHCREVLSAVASNFKASEMMFPPTLGNNHLNSKHHINIYICGFHPPIMHHISYIIYIYTPYMFTYYHTLYIYIIHPPTDQIKNHKAVPSRSRRRSCNWSRCSDRCGGGQKKLLFSGTRDGIYDMGVSENRLNP